MRAGWPVVEYQGGRAERAVRDRRRTTTDPPDGLELRSEIDIGPHVQGGWTFAVTGERRRDPSLRVRFEQCDRESLRRGRADKEEGDRPEMRVPGPRLERRAASRPVRVDRRPADRDDIDCAQPIRLGTRRVGRIDVQPDPPQTLEDDRHGVLLPAGGGETSVEAHAANCPTRRACAGHRPLCRNDPRNVLPRMSKCGPRR